MSRADSYPVSDAFEDRSIDTCVSCPKLCRHACPVAEAEARESTSPHALVVLSGLLKSKKATPEQVGAFPYHCSHCGACTSACHHQNDVPRILTWARSRVLAGRAAPGPVKELCGRFGVAGNPFGYSLSEILRKCATDAGRAIMRNAAHVYLPGCSTLAAVPGAATDFLRSLSLLGIFGIDVIESSAACCGLPLYWAGDIEGFRLHAKRFASLFEDVETLVVHDASCAFALKTRYPELGVPIAPSIRHVAEVLSEHVGEVSASLADKDAVTEPSSATETSSFGRLAYADTCHAARGLGLVDLPRQLIRAVTGGRPQEMGVLRGSEADCCGAAGLLPETAPATARMMGEERIRAFRESGATTLVTVSPRCQAHLLSIDPTLPVVDVSALPSRR